MPTLEPFAAAIFLVAAVPIGFFVSFSDLARMKIPNIANYALVIAYIILGLIALPFDIYLWGFANLAVVLLVGFTMNIAGLIGAGDAKFCAAAAPMIAVGDAIFVMFIFAAALLGGFFAHRLAKHSPLRGMVPHWESWEAGKRFPMGFPLSMTLVTYLAMVAFTR